MKVIGIVGTRSRDTDLDFNEVVEAFTAIYEPGDEIVSGGCPWGGDRFAEVIARRLEVPIKIYYAEWGRFGKAAGPIRNTLIAAESDVLIACVSMYRQGGTEDTIRKMRDKRVILV